MLKKYQIQKNENCPCGSGVKYKECCLMAQDAMIHSKKLEVLPAELLRKSFYKTCLYPDHSKCSSNIIGAHALQNNRILSKLSIDNHVIMLDRRNKPIWFDMPNGEKLSFYEYKSKGVNDATKYSCYCKKHDNDLFEDIEKDGCEYKVGDKKQEFLFAYKAFAFEYYLQTVNMKQFKALIKKVPSYLTDYKYVKNYRYLISKDCSLAQYKQKFDNCLLSNDYMLMETLTLEINEEIKFANFSCFSPKYNLEGKRLSRFMLRNDYKRNIFLTIFPAEGKSYILISYFKEDYKKLKKLIEALKRADENLIKFYLNIIVPIYSENIVICPDLWNNWDEDTKWMFTYYNNLNGQQDAMLLGLSFGLKNHKKASKNKRKKNDEYRIDYKSSKINMF